MLLARWLVAILPIYALTVYDTDDATILFDVSTDPAHARPYLKYPGGFPEQEVDFANGAVSIGQLNVEIVDVRQVATDQDTGYLTGQLADAGGDSQINGHRAVLTEDLGSGPDTVLDGVVRSVSLLDSFAAYRLELRDIRERERKARAFESSDTSTLLPRGVLDGYGVQHNALTWSGVPPTVPLSGFYRLDAANRGEIEINDDSDRKAEQILTDPMREAFESVAPIEGSPEVSVFDRWQVLWRDKALGGAYTIVGQIAHQHPSLPGSGGRLPYTVGGGSIGGLRLNNVVSGDTLPSNGQEVEFIVQYLGPTTPDWPKHLQGLTVGELLRNLYRGDYSEEDPRIRYDEPALLALVTPVRAKVEEPIDDVRAWAEENAYPIAFAAPTLDETGAISPITYLLPPAGVTLPDLNNSNARPVGGGWSHGSEDAKNVVKVTYHRDYRIPAGDESELALSDQIHARDITVERRIPASIALLGEQVLEVDSVLLRAVGTTAGSPITGDVADEVGAQVARQIAYMASDRLVLGGQYFALEGARSDVDVEALKPGSWVTVNVSWMPDYGTGQRGAARLAQVISRRNRGPNWAALTLLDAGSDQAPLAAPTVGAMTADALGVVSVPISALGTGDARVDYAVSATEPAAGSELWTFAGRIDATGTITTPPTPAGATVWVRARSEDLGRRPSAWTIATSVVVAQTARVTDVRVVISPTGVVTVEWTPNDYCLGTRIAYEVHGLATVPAYGSTVEEDASLGFVNLAVDPALGQLVSVEVTPFTGWTDPSVSGTAGPVVRANSEVVDEADYSLQARLIPIPQPSGGFKFDISYDLGDDVAFLYVNPGYQAGGTTPTFFTHIVPLTGSGIYRLRNAADTDDFVLAAADTLFSVKLRGSADSLDKIGGQYQDHAFEATTESGAGTVLSDGSSDFRGAKAVSGFGIGVGTDGTGNPEIRMAMSPFDAGSKSANFTLDRNDGPDQVVAITASVQLTNILNLVGSEPISVRIDCGANTLTLPSNVFEGPTLTFTGTAALSMKDFGEGLITVAGFDW